MNRKGCGRRRPWKNRGLSRHFPLGTEESHEKLKDRRPPDRELNPGPPEYEAGVLTTLDIQRVPGLFVLFAATRNENRVLINVLSALSRVRNIINEKLK
jgi:hypothetical protein